MSRILKLFIISVILSVTFIILPASTLAAKKFVPKKKSTTISSPKSRIPAAVKYRPDRLGIYLSFSHFKGLASINYSFTYNAEGIPQGAGGTVTANNNPTAQRELLFGTCSGGACRFHNNVSGARLTLTARFTSGKTARKTYRIKT